MLVRPVRTCFLLLLMALAPWPGSLFFFFNDTATTEIYTLSLHDALPIYIGQGEFLYQLFLVNGRRRAGVGCSSGYWRTGVRQPPESFLIPSPPLWGGNSPLAHKLLLYAKIERDTRRCPPADGWDFQLADTGPSPLGGGRCCGAATPNVC